MAGRKGISPTEVGGLFKSYLQDCLQEFCALVAIRDRGVFIMAMRGKRAEFFGAFAVGTN
jgi:hypothetical protein